jgi:hypothetical protein
MNCYDDHIKKCVKVTTILLNVTSGSKDWRAYVLSNFPCFPFILDNKVIASVEGFIQGIKYPEGDPRRNKAFAAWGKTAKELGAEADRIFVWWHNDISPNGILEYGCSLHHDLIARAIRAKFSGNLGAQGALIRTEGLTLTHDVGPEDLKTSLPATVFCKILTDLRDELIETKTISPP